MTREGGNFVPGYPRSCLAHQAAIGNHRVARGRVSHERQEPGVVAMINFIIAALYFCLAVALTVKAIQGY
jgi:hypothetical protein